MNQIKLLFLVAFVFSFASANAQEEDYQPKNAVLIDFAQPLIGQLQVGVLLQSNPEFDFFVFGRYNFNYIPNNIYVGHSGEPRYQDQKAKETGYTLGGQIRRTVQREESEYKKHLKPNTSRAIGYYGAWLEIGNSVSVDKYPYSRDMPDATLKWTNISGGLLTGFKSNLTKHLLLDIYGGLGYRSASVELSEPKLKTPYYWYNPQYDGAMNVDKYNRGIITARLGIQLGYTF
jgi:hypothetical protein